MYKKFNYNNDRLVGGFAAPFVLGALTGGVTYAAFNPYRPRPVYPTNNNYGGGGYGYGANYYGGYGVNNPYFY